MEYAELKTVMEAKVEGMRYENGRLRYDLERWDDRRRIQEEDTRSKCVRLFEDLTIEKMVNEKHENNIAQLKRDKKALKSQVKDFKLKEERN